MDVIEAVVAVIRRADRVLVIRRGPDVACPGYWTFPSGRIEPGESQAQAVVREMREELGLDVVPVAKVWECPTDDGRYRLHWWTVDSADDELVPHPGEVSGIRWLRPSEFGTLAPVFEGDRVFVREILPTL